MEMLEENWDDPNVPMLTAQEILEYNKKLDEFNRKRNYGQSSHSRNTKSGNKNLRSNRKDGKDWNSDQNSDRNWGSDNKSNDGSWNADRNYEKRWNNDKTARGGIYRTRGKNFSNNNLIMKVEGSKICKIIGKGGSKIRELQEQTGCQIKIGDTCEEDYYLTNVIIIGDKQSQEKCQKLIEELTKERTIEMIVSSYSVEKKETPVIDWEAVHKRMLQQQKEKWSKCPPLKKDFYIEDPEVANMSREEVERFRLNKNNIIVKTTGGADEKILNPVQTFKQAFQHYPDILREIEKQNFKSPSPIQCQAWPIILSGRDLIGIAQTGTGKTLAFLLPALIHIDGQKVPRSERGGANVLVIAPTRELALQIEKEVNKYSYKGIKCVCIYGGGSRKEQINVVTTGVEIIIGTPGRLNDLIEAKVINVTSITYLVLDEADRMLDMGFEPQIRKILYLLRPDKQAVMTSATWHESVQCLAEKYMTNPIEVHIGTLDITAVHSVTQTVWIVDDDEKLELVMEVINGLTEEDKVIIFVGKKITADNLSCDLSLNRVFCQSIHGDREQDDREQAIEDFKTGAVKILVATDVASRGLDISDITKVINYDFPKDIKEYVHRVGRTGRAGKTGEAITFFTRNDWAQAGKLITIMKEANQDIPRELYQMRDRFESKLQRKGEEGSHNGGKRRGRRYGPGPPKIYSKWEF